MNILLCSPYTGLGGISQWTNNILNYHNSINDDNLITPFYPDISAYNLAPTGGSIRRIIRGLKMYLPFVKQFNKEISKRQYTTVHISTSGSLSLIRDLLCLRKAKKRGIKTCLHFHFGRLPQIFETGGWEKQLLIKCLSYTDVPIAIDKPSYETLLKVGINSVVYLPNPLSQDVEKIIDENRCHREKGLIVFVGHLVKPKGVYELVSACKEIRNLRNIRLKLIGPYEEDVKNDLIDLAGKRYYEWLEIAGKCDQKTALKEMQRSELFILPSYSEGFPNVILESMACGCTIITTGVGAIPEMLDFSGGKCGILIKAQDDNDIKEKILEYLAFPENYRKMPENAYKRVREEYNINKIYSSLLNIWNNERF